MPIPLYFDECVNQKICSGLRLRGVTIVTAQEDGKDAEIDPIISRKSQRISKMHPVTIKNYLCDLNYFKKWFEQKTR